MVDDVAAGEDFAGYHVESVLGRGGMAVVYLAGDPRLGRKIALKVLPASLNDDQRFRDRFIRESQLAASLDHPNVIPIYEAGEFEGNLFIAMRYVDGIDLTRLIRHEDRLPTARTMSIIAQTAGALDAAHARGLIHRDVKPANILIVPRTGSTGTDHVYLSDFGVAKSSTSNTGLTLADQFVGTPDYVSPEQIEGDPVDGRADIYALAAVLYECLSGHTPFQRDSIMSIMYAHVHDVPPRISDTRTTIPAALDAVIHKGMAKDSADRYATAMDMVNAARTALVSVGTPGPATAPDAVKPTNGGDAVPPSAPAVQRPAPARVGGSRLKLAAIAVGIVVLAAAGAVGGILALQSSHSTATTPPVGSSATPTGTAGPATPAPTAVSTVGWKTYPSTCTHLSFKYPPEWSQRVGLDPAPASGHACNPVYFTTPSGNVLAWVPHYVAGGGCGPRSSGPASCPEITTLSSVPTSNNSTLGTAVIAQQVVCDKTGCDGRVVVATPAVGDGPTFAVGTARVSPLAVVTGPGFAAALYMTQSHSATAVVPPGDQSVTGMVASRLWTDSEDARAAIAVLASLS